MSAQICICSLTTVLYYYHPDGLIVKVAVKSVCLYYEVNPFNKQLYEIHIRPRLDRLPHPRN